MPVIDPQALVEERVQAIRSFHQTAGTPLAELDLSGGVDSAVMLALLARALGPGKVTAVYSDIDSSPESRHRARAVADSFRVRLVELDLTPLFRQLVDDMREAMWRAGYDAHAIERRVAADPTILGSIRSCLRAPVGRGINRLAGGGIRHGTGNECEDRWLRFFQKGGDGEVDTNPLAMLSKGEVYQLAHALGVPRPILEATPSPDLHANGDDHNDEHELRDLSGEVWTYSRVDPDTGCYAEVGTIERLSRFADRCDDAIFRTPTPEMNVWNAWIALATQTEFMGYSAQEVEGFLSSAKRMERSTRHKMNPNCPALGARSRLIELGLLTNSLVDESI